MLPGVPFFRIAKEVNADVKTVRKYAQCQDFSPKFPRKATRGSKIEPYNSFILNILENDRFVWYRQRHTAKRILRLLQEQGFDGAYSTVQRHVRQLRKQLQQQWNAAKNFEEQTWQAGYAQGDFGEADFNVNGKVKRLNFFVLSFPYSNAAYMQVMPGTNGHCVCYKCGFIMHFLDVQLGRCLFM